MILCFSSVVEQSKEVRSALGTTVLVHELLSDCFVENHPIRDSILALLTLATSRGAAAQPYGSHKIQKISRLELVSLHRYYWFSFPFFTVNVNVTLLITELASSCTEHGVERAPL